MDTYEEVRSPALLIFFVEVVEASTEEDVEASGTSMEV